MLLHPLVLEPLLGNPGLELEKEPEHNLVQELVGELDLELHPEKELVLHQAQEQAEYLAQEQALDQDQELGEHPEPESQPQAPGQA